VADVVLFGINIVIPMVDLEMLKVRGKKHFMLLCKETDPLF
jgi:hypothetical protein